MSLDTVRNFYEQRIFEHIKTRFKKEKDQEYLADLACVALNHLPPKYYRHQVDMLFYMSPIEHKEMDEKVTKALDDAVKFIAKKTQI